MIPNVLANPRPELIALLGWTLLHFLWQGAAVALLFAAVNAALRQASAESRYAAGCVALMLMLALPIATFATLSAGAGRLPGATPALRAATIAPLNTLLATPVAPVRTAGMPSTRATTFARDFPRLPLATMLPVLVGLWSLGVAFLSLRFLAGWFAAQRLRRSGVTLAAERWQATLTRLAARLEVRATLLYESVRVEVPSVVGWLKPVILVPASTLTGLTAAQVEAVLAHELAHIRRHDFLANLVQCLVETLLFYHPAVWWVSHRVRIERENCCDDLAIAVCGDPIGYARALAELEASRAPRLVVAASGGSLIQRIARLLRGTPRRSADPPMWLGPVVALVMLTGLAGVTGWARSDSESPAHAMIVAAKHLAREGSVLAMQTAERVRVKNLAEAGSELAKAQAGLAEAAAGLAEAHAGLLDTGAKLADLDGFLDVGGLTDLAGQLAGAAKRLEYLGDVGVVAGTDERACTDKHDEPADVDAQLESETDESPIPELTEDDLLDLAGAGLNPRTIRAYAGVGITSAKHMTALANQDVRPDYVRRLHDLGYDELSAADLIRLRQHGVTVEEVEALHEMGYDNVPAGDLVKLRDHGVPPKFIAGMKWLGLGDLPIDVQIAMRDQGVTVEEVARFRVLGYRDLDPADLIQLRQQDVTPEFAGLMRRFRGEAVPVGTLVRLRQQGVEPGYVAGMRRLDYEFSCDELIQLRQQGVTPEWLAGIAENGYDQLSAGEIVRLYQHDVSGPFLRECRRAGYGKLSVPGLVRLRELGIVPSASDTDE